jgi:ribosomal protein S18 acetylase RimI-like enzyme
VKERRLPPGYRLENLRREHPRKQFRCGEERVDHWIATKSWQSQSKHLSATRVLLGPAGDIAGFYTLATGQIDFGDLPKDEARHLPRRQLPVVVLAWLGVDRKHQGLGLGDRLLVNALVDCFEAGKTFPFIAVILDCVSDAAKAFYRRWDFGEMPGHPYRLYLTAERLAVLCEAT